MKPIPLATKLQIIDTVAASRYYERPFREIWEILDTCSDEFYQTGDAFIIPSEFFLSLLRPTVVSEDDEFIHCKDAAGTEITLFKPATMFLTERGLLRLGMLLGGSPVANQLKDELLDSVLGGVY